MFVQVAQFAPAVHMHHAQGQLVQRALQRAGVALGLLQPPLGAHEAAHPRRGGAQAGELFGCEFALAQVVVHRQHMHAHLGRGLDDAVDHGINAQGPQVVGIKRTPPQRRGADQLLAQRAAARQRRALLALQRLAPGVAALDEVGVAREKIVGHAPLVGGQRVVRAGQGAEQHHLVAAQRLAQAAQQALHHAGLAQGLQAFGHQGLETRDAWVRPHALHIPLLTGQVGLLFAVCVELRRIVGALPPGRHHSGEGCGGSPTHNRELVHIFQWPRCFQPPICQSTSSTTPRA